ncbi:MAG TPA: IS1380 family transposase [Pseudonocardiaceae bacterium]|nr:IS1380 family transposase [Pseudonocardiaceae bacterium]
MLHSTTEPLRFDTPLGVPLEAAFDAGRLTSDGGLPWLAAADHALGLCAALAACVPEWRTGPVRHSLETLVRQRVFQIACGYADQDDADTLRSDPLLKLVCGRWPERGADLASQPTLSRLENAVDRPAVEALAAALVALYLRERGRAGAPAHLVLDLDGTDDPAHGHQEGVAYHGYYGQHIYHPLLVFDGQTGQLITAVLRPGHCHGSRFAVLVLRRLLKQLRAAWPGVTVEIRADSGFAVPRLYAWCEAQGVTYTIGLIPNPRLEAVAAPLLAAAQAQSAAQGGAKVRLAGETAYQAASWPAPRRVVYKAEALAQGPNTRFVVTTRPEAPLAVYDWYVDRGQPENWVKDLKNALQGDRLSDHRFWANAFRLLLHAAAYWLLDTLRRWLARAAAEAARVQLDTLRLRLLKIGGRVRELADRICLHLASSHPGEPLWLALSLQLHGLRE